MAETKGSAGVRVVRFDRHAQDSQQTRAPMSPPRKGHKCAISTISTHSITKEEKKSNENDRSEEVGRGNEESTVVSHYMRTFSLYYSRFEQENIGQACFRRCRSKQNTTGTSNKSVPSQPEWVERVVA